MHVYAMTPQKAEEFISEGDIVIVGDRSDAQLDAINRNVSVLILTGGCEIEPSILSEAEKRNIVVLRTNFNSFMAARLLPQSVPISYVMTTENIVTFDLDDFVGGCSENHGRN
jgi:Predicted transcriptional regulator containing CBS domains